MTINNNNNHQNRNTGTCKAPQYNLDRFAVQTNLRSGFPGRAPRSSLPSGALMDTNS